MVHLSAWWSWVQQLCVNVAEESCCPQRLPSQTHGMSGALWVGGSLIVLGTLAAGQCHVQLPICTLLAVLQGTGKRAMSPGGKGPP